MSTLEEKTEKNIPKKSSGDGKILFSIVSIIILIICGVLIASYFEEFSKSFNEKHHHKEEVKFSDKSVNEITSQKTENITDSNSAQTEVEIQKLKEIISKQTITIEELQNKLKTYKESDSVSLRLSYVIKPKPDYVAECTSYALGGWEIPKECKEDTIAKVKKEIQSDRKIVVWEVIPVVDENPYGGLSPELKQEGLASFRAKSVVSEIGEAVEDITILKGFTQQEKDKRGYRLKAYYLE